METSDATTVAGAELAFAPIARQAELVRTGAVSPRELVETYLERIASIDPELNAFRVVLAERALAEAAQAEARVRAGEERPLLGVPVAIKDDTDVGGEITAIGSNAFGPPASRDAEVVRRLRAAGAIVIGKTHVPELCQWPFTETATWGVTRNPWDLDRTPGGSSGGAAAAVAAGLVGIAHGSDGAGSVRIPSACCGLFGIKPQRGRISLQPRAEGWHGLATFGPIARSVLDAALFLDATAGAAPGDPAGPPAPERPFVEAARTALGRLRIAVSYAIPRPIITRLDPEVRRATEEMAATLRRLGHDVVERDPDYGPGILHVIARYLRGIHDDAAAMAHPERLERRTRTMARIGGLIPAAAVARSKAAEASFTARVGSIFADHDVLLTPALAAPPLPIGKLEGRGALMTFQRVAEFVPFEGIWNVTGQPAAAVPAGFTSTGVPLGVQLVGRPNDEATLLSLAAQIEAERPWADRRPPVA